jgi:hypothetical protein
VNRKRHDLTGLKLDDRFDHLSEDIQKLVLKLEGGETQLTKLLTIQHEDVIKKLDSLRLVSATSQHTYDHQLVLGSFFFPKMLSRQERIERTYPETYE